MDVLNLYISEELVESYLRLVITYGICGAFALATVLIIITMGIYKALGLLNNTIK